MPSPLAVLHKLRPPADPGTLGLYARTRDPLLLAELVRRHGPLVWGVCRRALPHPADAEDAYQATWLVLARNPGAVRTPAALPAFLHTVAVRACRRVRRKRPVTGPADHLPGRDPPAADALSAREYLQALDDELARLPDKLRRPLVLCFLDGHTQDEAAAALGVSVSTLKRRLEAGKAVLRARLAGRGVDLAAALAAAGLMGVGAPAVTAGGAGAVATAISTEVLTAMWMLNAKGWAAGLLLAAGLTAAGGGLLVADDNAKPGAGPGKALAERPAAVELADPNKLGEPARVADDNFEVTAPTAEQATQIIRTAEAARLTLAVRWLGKELPKWERRCEIRYKPTGGTDGGGATHFTFAASGVVSMRMELFGGSQFVLSEALPHEVMHTVLASHFSKPVPRWADEGISVLAEPESAQHKHAVKTAELLNQGRGIPLRHLFALEEYPKDMHVLFAQGYSVCRFLLGRKPAGGEAALLDFVRRGMAAGWEPAAKEVYGFADLDAMQAEWVVSLRVPQPPAADPLPAPVPLDPAGPVMVPPPAAVATEPAANFKVYAQTPAEAARLLQAAEAARRSLAVRWLGRELPAWPERCLVTYPVASGEVSGSTELRFGTPGGRPGPVSFTVSVGGPLPAVLADVLPPQVMHTVMATHFGKPLPRWAEDGLAGLAASEASQQKRARRAAEAAARVSLPLRELFLMTEYPKEFLEGRALFRDQGYSVCRFLLGRKPVGGEAALLAFVGRGMSDGWEAAAKAVYGVPDLDALQAEWRAGVQVPLPPAVPPVPQPAPGSQVLPPPATVPPAPRPAAPPPAKPADPVGAAYDDVIGGLEQAIKAADEAAAAQQKVAERYEKMPGVSSTEKLNNTALVARYRENAIQARVKLAEVRLDRAKFERANPPPSAPVALPQRLLRERVETARRALDLARSSRTTGDISRDEAVAFVTSMTLTARQLYDAVRAADATSAGTLAAAREWYVTARDGEQYMRAAAGRGQVREQVVLAATLARLDAEAALIQAAAAAPPEARDGIAPFAAAPAGYSGKVAATDPVTFEPAAELAGRGLIGLRVSRNGKPVGLLVLTAIGPENKAGYGVMLPAADGTVPEVKPGDEARP